MKQFKIFFSILWLGATSLSVMAEVTPRQFTKFKLQAIKAVKTTEQADILSSAIQSIITAAGGERAAMSRLNLNQGIRSAYYNLWKFYSMQEGAAAAAEASRINDIIARYDSVVYTKKKKGRRVSTVGGSGGGSGRGSAKKSPKASSASSQRSSARLVDLNQQRLDRIAEDRRKAEEALARKNLTTSARVLHNKAKVLQEAIDKRASEQEVSAIHDELESLVLAFEQAFYTKDPTATQLQVLAIKGARDSYWERYGDARFARESKESQALAAAAARAERNRQGRERLQAQRAAEQAERDRNRAAAREVREANAARTVRNIFKDLIRFSYSEQQQTGKADYVWGSTKISHKILRRNLRDILKNLGAKTPNPKYVELAKTIVRQYRRSGVAGTYRLLNYDDPAHKDYRPGGNSSDRFGTSDVTVQSINQYADTVLKDTTISQEIDVKP